MATIDRFQSQVSFGLASAVSAWVRLQSSVPLSCTTTITTSAANRLMKPASSIAVSPLPTTTTRAPS